jgi:integrase
MGWVEPHGKGFRGRVEVAGERLSTETVSTRKAAKRLLGDLERALNDPDWQDPHAGDVLFRDWVEEWKKTRAGLADSTTAGDLSRLRTHLVPQFGELLLSEIDALRIRQWVSDLSSRRKPKTVRSAHALLHSVLQLAVDSNRLRKNPCKGSRLPTVARKDQVLLNARDVEIFIDGFVDEIARALVETAAGTGMRWGELAGLRVGRVNVQRRQLRVRETLSETGGVLKFKETPKTDASYRTIAFTHAVADALRPLIAGKDPDDLVFVSRDCAGSCRHCQLARDQAKAAGMRGKQLEDRARLVHAFRNRNFRRDHWDPALLAAAKRGMNLRPTPHDLRHTHVALLIDAGVQPAMIQKRLGHKSITVTMDTYGYLLPTGEEKVLAALEKALPPARGRTLDDELADLLGGTDSPKTPGGTTGG